MATVIRARVPKLRCDVCDGFPQMEVPWARPRVSYTNSAIIDIFKYLIDMAGIGMTAIAAGKHPVPSRTRK